ncbi:S8 family serine peptidase [Promicromonospora sp. Marseille-Q5078]
MSSPWSRFSARRSAPPGARRRGAARTVPALVAAAALTGLALPAAAVPAVAPATSSATSTGTATGSSTGTSTADVGDKIRPGVSRALDAHGTADFWVRLGDTPTAGLDAAAGTADWDARGAAVVDALRENARESQKGVLATLDAADADYETFWATNAVYVSDGSTELASTLAGLASVDALWPSRTYDQVEPATPEAARDAATTAVEWGLTQIHADDVWASGVDGKGVTVASIDSGVQYDHPALVGKYRGNNGDGTFTHDYNWLDTSGRCDGAPCDVNGHGTHTMGTMVGSDADHEIGVAPGATWITANGCDTCSDVDLVEAAQWMLAPTKTDGTGADPARRPQIINNSWGTQTASVDPFMEDVQEAWAASGIFAVWSNGNIGPSCSSAGSPGSRIINYSVGAYDSTGTIASFSSRGSGQDGGVKPDISAPGVAVRSSVPGGSYGVLDGTSMAAPHVSGAIALLWSAQPSLVGDLLTTRAMLDETAVDAEDLQCGGTADDNNVYGEGRLDALALVQAGDRGPIGTLAIDVTDTATGDAVTGAEVHLTGPDTDRDVTLDAAGHGSLTLPVGTYDVAVRAFGYDDAAATADVTEDATTSRKVALTPTPRAEVTGTVTDGSGHGWPLYATVAVDGTPLGTVHTDPKDGTYTLSLPVGAEYDLRVAAAYPGYETVARTVDMTDAAAGDTVSLDVDVPVDTLPCTAPGYHQVQPRVAAVTFDPGSEIAKLFAAEGLTVDLFTPDELDQVRGYDVVLWGYNSSAPTRAQFDAFLADSDANGTGVVFLDYAFGTWNGIATLSAMTGVPTAVQRSNGSGTGTYYEVSATHPVLDGLAVGDRVRHERPSGRTAWFTGWTGEGREVVATAGTEGSAPRGAGIGLQQRPNNRHVLMSMSARYPADWSADSKQVLWNAVSWANTSGDEVACVPDPGALVLGQVTDANTGSGVPGATVTAGDIEVRAAATEDDDATGDGFYWFFAPDAGDVAVEAAATRYSTASTTVTAAPDTVAVADVALPAGRIDVTATGTTPRLTLGGAAAIATINVTNTGTAPVDLRFGERDGDFTLLRADGSKLAGGAVADAKGAPLRELDGPVTLGAHGSAKDARAASAAEPAAGPAAEPWTPVADYPTAIMDNAVVRLDGTIYSIGGSDGAGPTAAVWAYDPATLAWREVAPLPAARNAMTAAVVDGRIVATGGWGPDGVAAETWIYDAAKNAWEQATSMPAARSAAGAAVVNGELYVIGGCSTSSCAPMSSEVLTYDVGADAWSAVADYPQGVAFAGCGAIDWTVVCSGGNNGASTERTYQYDPGTDEWSRRADAPVDAWGAASAVANDRLLVVGGVQAGTITNAAFAYDPGADTWERMPNAGTSRYRGGAACGFYKVGGSVQNYIPDPAAEVLPGFDDCAEGSTDVAWLSTDTTSAELAVGESVEVAVAVTPAVDQPGAYTGTVAVQESTPYPQAPVAFAMTVDPPKSWGKLAGVVSGASCSAATAPLQGATVQLTSAGDRWTFTTPAAGSWSRWFDKKAHRAFDVAASKDGYSIGTMRASIRSGGTVRADLTLDRLGC